MKILLTGGNGFIGRNLKEQLSLKHEIIAPQHTELDFSSIEAVRGLFSGGKFDAVIHTASIPSKKDCRDFCEAPMKNLMMFSVLTRAAAESGVKKFLHYGSGGEYGALHNLCSVSEEEIGKNIPQDVTHYSKYLMNFIAESGMSVTNLRCFGVFGQYEDYTNRFISNAICRALCGYSITLRQDRIYSYLYIDDLAEITDIFLRNEFKYRDYNITPDEKWSLLDIARLVRRITAKDVPIDLASASGKGFEYSGSNSRLKHEINFTFTPMYDAVKMLTDRYILNFDMIDREKLLYSGK